MLVRFRLKTLFALVLGACFCAAGGHYFFASRRDAVTLLELERIRFVTRWRFGRVVGLCFDPYDIKYSYDLPNATEMPTRSLLRDDDLLIINNLTYIDDLDLGGTSITDVGIQRLTHLSNLKSLDLSRTNVSDASVNSICYFTNLHTLDISKTQITQNGLDIIKKHIPRCNIRR